METQNKGRMEGILADLGRKIDHLLHKALNTSEEAREELNLKMEELNRSREKFEKEFREFADDEEKWKEVQQRLQAAGEELKKAFEITFTKKKTES